MEDPGADALLPTQAVEAHPRPVTDRASESARYITSAPCHNGDGYFVEVYDDWPRP